MHERSLKDFSSELLVAIRINNIFHMLLLLGRNDFYPDSSSLSPFGQPFKSNIEARSCFPKLDIGGKNQCIGSSYFGIQVLASLIIRLALAETFCLKDGAY